MSVGLWVMFGIVLVPLYVTLLGWFLGEPRDYRTAGIGVGVLAGLLLLMIVASFVPIAFQVVIPG
ncbi:hypothetical protein [Natrialbaceae archaeon AArc-T1-2]|uniref:hypothetical protein n=1 Tax=Natrialbaceae archaeon AArc-T1-2 TaxID=3053904 RepID=UPI00255AEFC8|nr:hypothetical protein [Natrialbaceae archaeon AArc-T1-2]WIV66484.1 hypothetical protein QQ977_12390 [Natrialbaceae archaeon AArc-T1-2]